MRTDHHERGRDATVLRLDMAQPDLILVARSLSCHPSAGRFGMTITCEGGNRESAVLLLQSDFQVSVNLLPTFLSEAVPMQRNKSAVATAMLVLSFTSCAFAADQYAVIYERGVAVKMRDGVTLRADIFRPNAEGKFPVLLQRTPYNKDNGVGFGIKAAAHGYIVIFQDVRGRYASEGDWYVFKNEPNDGYDTVEWAADLPYSDGRVGMFGGSYVGATQMLAAIAHPPHLAGICPVVTASNYHENWTYTGGAFVQRIDEDCTTGHSLNAYEHTVVGQMDT